MMDERTQMHAVTAEEAWQQISANEAIERDRQLRETIAIIQGLTELLMDSKGSLEDPVTRAALESIHRHSVSLRTILDRS